ncbi:thiamine phosphate synthase [Vibrio sinaloensis]|uniref:thiamine phosphate synthase n=1 Tax=Photobacterium sp. (strain ATCC 43367) TaxID=379097 RepID=UPI0022AE7147|nr:thiamine phosphate synthase [Vibrio sinaloensis]MCZ4295933.1 thiamine phosphate synthase [Vibrio sinaloensis]
MMKILIPASCIAMTGNVQQCLLLAREQGFDIECIELGVSPTLHIQLVRDQHITHISTDLISKHDGQVLLDYVLYYHGSIDIERYLEQPKNSIFIDVEDAEQDDVGCIPSLLDIWRHPDTGEVRALSAAPSLLFSPKTHFVWVVTLLALDFPIEDALTLARAMLASSDDVSRETLSNPRIGFNKRWPNSYAHFPVPVLNDSRLGIDVAWSTVNQALSFPSLSKLALGLYPVVDSVEWIERLLELGVKTIQLRIKDPHRHDLEQQIERAVALGRQYNAQVFINDYWQLAIKHGAFGVHLGQEDIEQSNLDLLREAGLCLGLSTHGYYELLRIAQIYPSYIALGHIFPTTTKQMPSLPQGLVRLALYQKLIDTIPYHGIQGLPTVAIGGIDQTNAQQVWQCGVSSLAVVRAITEADSIEQAIEFFQQVMSKHSVRDKNNSEELAHAK